MIVLDAWRSAVINLDLWLVEEIFEKRIAHPFQRFTGKDCFWLAKAVFYCVSSILCMGSFVLLFFPNMDKIAGSPPQSHVSEIMFSLSFAAFFIGIFFHFVLIRDVERIVQRCCLQGLRNPIKIDETLIWIRLLVLGQVLIGSSLVLVVSVDTMTRSSVLASCFLGATVFLLLGALATALYLCACDPLPPAQSKIREWFESFSQSLAPTSKSVLVRI